MGKFLGPLAIEIVFIVAIKDIVYGCHYFETVWFCGDLPRRFEFHH